MLGRGGKLGWAHLGVVAFIVVDDDRLKDGWIWICGVVHGVGGRMG